MSPVTRCSDSAIAPAVGAAPALPSPFSRVMRGIINLPTTLFAVPSPDYQRAYQQASQAGLTAQSSADAFVAGIRHRLQQPEALALMQTDAEYQGFSSLSRWLPELPGPILSDLQRDNLIAFILGPADVNSEQPAWRQSALYQLMVDEINRAAAAQQQGIAQRALPELLRLNLVSDLLQRAHPLLPAALWAGQVLWQIRQLGVLNTLDAELKRLLIHWLMALDSPPQRQALSDRMLWRYLNDWTEQRLEDFRRCPLVESLPPVTIRADGWQLNSDLNMPVAAGDELMVKVHRCYELIKPVTQPVNIAVGCAPVAENRSYALAEWQGEAQFARGAGVDEAGKLWLSLQLESGASEFRLQGLARTARRQRPLTLTSLAGADDQLMLLATEPGMLSEEIQAGLLPLLLGWSTQQLKREPSLTSRVVGASQWSGEGKNSLKPLLFQPGWHQVAVQRSAAGRQSEPGGSAWPLPGAAAQSTDNRLRLAANRPPIVNSAGITAEDFYTSLLFKYQEELSQYPLVTVTLTHQGTIRDRQYPLLQALQILSEAPTDSPQLTLQYHPDWSRELRDDVENFLLRNYAPDLDPTQPMDWESVENQYAAWQTGAGLARRGMDKMAEIIKKMQSPVWDVRRWIDDKIKKMVEECGGDSIIITGEMPVGVGVRLPAGAGRQSLPVPVVAGSWHSVGNYTLQDILTREYLRGNYRYESLEFIFPPEINQRLQKKIITTDIQSIYMAELSQALAEGDVREGMLSLFKTLYNRAVDAWCARATRQKSEFAVLKIRSAIAAGQVYNLKLHGYSLNNLVFIAAGDHQGVILSLWGEKSWEVNIDLSGYISFYDQSQAEDLQKLIYESMPIKGRIENTPAAVSRNQIQINFSGHYNIEFKGKAWVKKTWVEPIKEKAILALAKTSRVEADLLNIFIATLLSDMDYLVKSNAEHLRDSAIEVLTTLAWMIGLYAIPTLGVQVAGASASAAKLVGAVTNWKSSMALSTSLTIFPNLVKAITSDRHKEAQKAWHDAVLGLMGEGGGLLFRNLCPRVLTGLFKQGGRVVKVSIDQIPPSALQKITGHVEQTFSAYQAERVRVYGLTSQQPQPGKKHYPFSFDAKLPAPTLTIEKDLAAFPEFIARHHSDLLKTSLFADPLKLPAILQQFLQSQGYQVEIGGLVQWGSINDVATRYHYLIRATRPVFAQNIRQGEMEKTILDFFPERYDPRDINGIFIIDEPQWQAGLASLPQNTTSVISIQWFNTLDSARGQYRALRAVETELMTALVGQIITRPDWYHKFARKRALKEIDEQQQMMRIAISALEENINFLKSGPNTLSLQLSDRYASGELPPYDLLGININNIVASSLSKRVVPLPAGNYRLIGTDLRGICQNRTGEVTVTNFGSSPLLLQQQRIQSYLPEQIAEAGRAAEISMFYASKVDEYLVETSRTRLPVPQLRLKHLADNDKWLGRSARHIKVPLIIAVNHTLAEHGTENNNQLGATLPVAAILFVLAPDDMTRQVSNILAQLRPKPIPVSPLLIEDAPQLQQLIMLAESYALLPLVATNRQVLLNDIYRPWLPIINLQASVEFITAAQAEELRKQTSAENYPYFLGDAPKRVTCREDISNAQPGARLVFSDVDAGPGEPPISHAMLMLNDGAAVGGNNQIIGGREAWQKIYLLTHNWVEDKQHGFVLKAAGSRFSLRIQTSSAPPTPTLMPRGKNLANEIWRVITLAYDQLHKSSPVEGGIATEDEPAWIAAIDLYQQAGLLDMATAVHLSNTTNAEEFQAFLGQSAQIARSWSELFNAVPGSRLAFTETEMVGSVKKTRMVHAMILTYGGYAVGLNNRVLGGEAGWGKIHLGGLQFSADIRKGLVVEVGERRFRCLIIPPWS